MDVYDLADKYLIQKYLRGDTHGNDSQVRTHRNDLDLIELIVLVTSFKAIFANTIHGISSLNISSIDYNNFILDTSNNLIMNDYSSDNQKIREN